MTDKHVNNMEKAIAFWDVLPPEKWNQHRHGIDDPDTCGCFGWHMAVLFDCKWVIDEVTSFSMAEFIRQMPDLLGIERNVPAAHGAPSDPFGYRPWRTHPAEVLRSILDDRREQS